jgi:membrane protease YdiL (CAAX protease family)
MPLLLAADANDAAEAAPDPNAWDPSWPDIILCLIGVTLLSCWLLKTRLGREALNDAKPRRNMLPIWTVLAVFMAWAGGFTIALYLRQSLFPSLGPSQTRLADTILVITAHLFAAALALALARLFFARGLRGFGLDWRTIPRDLAAALAHLLAVMPLVFAMILLVAHLGKTVSGPEYEIPQHQELQNIEQTTAALPQILILISTILIVPLFEELFFRGFVQTTIRSFVHRPWVAVIAASLIFVAFHADLAHWPALLILGLCMGYAYEKSGSLFRAIFIHAMFNSLGALSALFT